jgi:CheY-like chemotaxis protein
VVHTILVVEDEFGVADVLMATLEDEGYRVVLAANGRQGLDQLLEARPALIIADYMMPIMDGAAMGRAVRATPGFERTPIIMTSAVAEAPIRAHFSDFQAFLRKPFRSEELVEVVGRLLKEGGGRRT